MGPFVFLDVETTGMNPARHAIIEIACLKWQDGKILDRFESLVHPRAVLPYEIVLLTGINDDMVKKAPDFSEIKEKILDFVSDAALVGHNIAFDAAFLKSHHLELKNSSIDTVVLAHILLRKESSYALEVLMKKYRLPLRDSHRAMADVETTVDFFEFLLGKIEEIPKDARKTLERVLEKSSWEGKKAFDMKKYKTQKKNQGSAIIEKDKIDRKSISPNDWGEEITEKFLKGEKILLESSREIAWKELKNQPLVVAYSSMRQYNKMLEESQKYGISAYLLKEPRFFISPKKFNGALAEKNIFPTEETPFFLKMALWLKETKTGDREELSLEREEYGLFEMIADEEGQDFFWKTALEKTQKSNVIFIHHYGFARGLAEKILEAKNGKHRLIIMEASRLEDNLTQAMKKKYAETDLRAFFGNSAALLFGLLGIFYERFAPEEFGGMRGNVIVDKAAQNSIEWQRFFEALQHFQPHPKKEEILSALVLHKTTIQWISNISNEIALHSAPIFIGEAFRTCIKPFVSVFLQSEALSADGSFQFIREILELDSGWQAMQDKRLSSQYHFQLTIPDDFPEPRTEGYFKRCIKLFTEIVEKQKGKILFILSSKKTLEATYQAILPKVKTAYPSVKLLAVGPSGGVGKSVALFLENPENSIFMATNQILSRLQEIEDFLETVVFQKIPFDSPDDPILKKRAEQFENGFKNYTLPRAVIKFRETLAELQQSKTLKNCYLLDSRLLTRDYGRMFF